MPHPQLPKTHHNPITTPPQSIAIIGGGAAGFFCAINHKIQYPNNEVVIFEKSKQVLAKVKISGGGRCNVTHACFDIKNLVQHYPRGHKELLSVFNQFQPLDTIEWFKKNGNIRLLAEADGRMFPHTNTSQTIVDCFYYLAKKYRITIQTNTSVQHLAPKNNHWELTLNNSNILTTATAEKPLTFFKADKVVVATGGSQFFLQLLHQHLQHNIINPVPSLFSFNIHNNFIINDLAGVSVSNVEATIPSTPLQAHGALLITHWGLSAPAILKLSAWGAQILAQKNYEFTLHLNFCPTYTTQSLYTFFASLKNNEFAKKQIINHTPIATLPLRLWKKLVEHTQIINNELTWANANKKQLQTLSQIITQCPFEVKGKSTNKDEFVTCGGVDLKEVNFKTMESKLHKGLFFAGEALNIDGVTGGFNFQAAWSTAYLAAHHLGNI